MSLKRVEFMAAGAASIALTLPAHAAAERSPKTALHIRRLHWAGISLVVGDAQLFIDPVIENPGDPPLSAEAKDRFAIVSHHHGDHFDAQNIATAIGDRGFLVIEESVAKWADTRTLHVQRVAMYQPAMLPRGAATFCVIPVPAIDGLGAPQVSWVIEAAGLRALHLGDTQWHGGFWDIARAYGPFDVMFVPINGFQQVVARYRKVGQPMSMSPQQARSAVELFNPKVVVPIHYGEPDPPTYIEVDKPLEEFTSLMTASTSRVAVLKQGETLTLTRGLG
ncbi:MAG: MBL fold metallo-hydrolase [Candidatus Eremiobacteraeota bacterium]|nr:MBL fold metallo-hydrolase [Candidatus Eremiobacteraeota bacterium]